MIALVGFFFELLLCHFLSLLLDLLALAHEPTDSRLEFIRLRVYLPLSFSVHVVLRHVFKIELKAPLLEVHLILLVKLLFLDPLSVCRLPGIDDVPSAG